MIPLQIGLGCWPFTTINERMRTCDLCLTWTSVYPNKANFCVHSQELNFVSGLMSVTIQIVSVTYDSATWGSVLIQLEQSELIRYSSPCPHLLVIIYNIIFSLCIYSLTLSHHNIHHYK